VHIASAGYVLKNATIQGGLSFPAVGNITGSATFGRGTKDQPIWIRHPGGSYKRMVQYAGGKHVVLYDTQTDRGWLMDGASALLHLARTSLITDQHSTELLDLQQFVHANPINSVENAAGAALIKNMKLLIDKESEGIYTERETVGNVTKEKHIERFKHYYFKDLVVEAWNSLEKMYEHQEMIAKSPDIQLRLPGRDRLEGYTFMDIVDSNFPIRPKQHPLKKSGKSWVDFARAIGAMTLFGTGFGNLIESITDASVCKSWKQIPPGEEYLTVCVSTLKKICTRHGDITSEPLQLAPGIYWQKVGRLFETCICGPHHTCNRVQVLHAGTPNATKYADLFKFLDGAVVFGSAPRRKMPWFSKERPAEGCEIIEDGEDFFGSTNSNNSSALSSRTETSKSDTFDSALTPDTTVSSTRTEITKPDSFGSSLTSAIDASSSSRMGASKSDIFNSTPTTNTIVASSSPGASDLGTPLTASSDYQVQEMKADLREIGVGPEVPLRQELGNSSAERVEEQERAWHKPGRQRLKRMKKFCSEPQEYF